MPETPEDAAREIPGPVRDGLAYLGTGGLAETACMADAHLSAGSIKVRIHTGTAIALCMLAAEALSARGKLDAQAADALTALRARVARLEKALAWYAEQAEGCRKIGSAGDPARQALDRDGGKRARAALSPSAAQEARPQPDVRVLDGWPHAGGEPIIPLEYPAGDPPAFFETTAPAHPDAIAAAEARGRREGVEAAAKVVEAAAGELAVTDYPFTAEALLDAAAAVRALSSIPPQEADPT
jgi:hypothetical protein